MKGWRACKLGDVLTLKRGYDLPHQHRVPGPVPIVSSSGITDHHAEAKVRGPGVVTGRYGTLGEVFYVKSDFWPLNTALYVQDFKGNDPRFASYFLKALNFGTQNAAGAVPGVNRNHLHAMDVCLPPLVEQRRIAGIVSAYDDLIENCGRRIRVLDEMARALYREWFVNFRYPGHEKVPLVDSPLGRIPKGWYASRVGEMVENFDRLRRPLSQAQRSGRGGPYPYYGAAKVFDRIDDYLFDGEYLLFAEDGSVSTPDGFPVLQLVNERFWPNNHTHVLRGRTPISTGFLYVALSLVSVLPYITGAAQPKITQENLNRIPLIRAPDAVHASFDDRVLPLLSSVHLLGRRAQNLRRTRDLLLPRLLSGQLSIEDAAA